MKNHRSLKQRLLALVLSIVVVVWIVTAALTYFDAREELDETLDAHLAQSASLLSIQATHELEEIEVDHAPLLHKYSRRVAFQVWEDGTTLRMHSFNAPTQALASNVEGFSDAVINGIGWRVFSTWDENHKNLIQVAELSEMREKLARSAVGNLLEPLLISLPLLALLLWFGVARGLKPLATLTDELAMRAPDNLAPLQGSTAPLEVVPLIERLNKLFVRINASMQKERRFTADAAHELRTPVAGIKAQVQVANAATTNAERVHALNNAILGCDRATHLIEQLLTLARIDNLSEAITESCLLRALSVEVIAALAPTALNKGVRIELMEGDDAAVLGNPVLLRILLRNLIDNAVSHTPAGTTVRVCIAAKREDIQLTVCDNGPGIPAEDMNRVAERFYRPVGTEASGSGLGLSIVKQIAEIHAATLALQENAEGSGLMVSVTFKK
ncbi:MAG: ATP-binding protein [Gallionellaceae bacterium]